MEVPLFFWMLFSSIRILPQDYTEINVKLQQIITLIFVYFANRHYTDNSVYYRQSVRQINIQEGDNDNEQERTD